MLYQTPTLFGSGPPSRGLMLRGCSTFSLCLSRFPCHHLLLPIMPRLHLGNPNSRGRRSVTASSSTGDGDGDDFDFVENANDDSASSTINANRNSSNANNGTFNKMKDDAFDYGDDDDEFDYDDMINGNNNGHQRTSSSTSYSSNKRSSTTNNNKATLIQGVDSRDFSPVLPNTSTKQTTTSSAPHQYYTTLDDSVSEEDSDYSNDKMLLMGTSKRLKKKKSSTAATSSISAGDASDGGGGVSPRVVAPTVSSRKITAASLSKVKSSSNSSNSNSTSLTMEENDENTINHTKKKAPVLRGDGYRKKTSLTSVNDGSITTNKSNSQRSGKQKVSFTKNTKAAVAATFSGNGHVGGEWKKKRGADDGKTSTYKKSGGGKEGATTKTGGGGRRRKKKDKSLLVYSEEEEGLEDADDDDEEGTETRALFKKSKRVPSTSAKAARFCEDATNITSSNSSTSTMNTNSYNLDKTSIQILPFRGIAIDNRAIPTFEGDSMARHSFLAHFPEFLEGGLEKGVLVSAGAGADGVGSVIASSVLVEGGTMGIRASYLYDGCNGSSCHGDEGSVALDGASERERALWLSDFLTPVNHGFGSNGGGLIGSDMELYNEHGQQLPDGFAADDSWVYFGDLGEPWCCLLFAFSSFV